MKKRILIMNPIKLNPSRIASATPEQQLEKPKDYARRIAKIFRQECISIITKYRVPTMIRRFTIPAMIHYVQFERILEMQQDDGDAELKTLGTAIQDIGENSANGDFAFSDKCGTVWIYDNSRYNSGDIVPDQVTPASDATPLVDSGTGVAGTSNEYSRGDHKHQLQVSDVLPSKDTSVGTVGQASSYARSDHQHPIQTVDTIPVNDSADESYDTVDSYVRNVHSYLNNIQINASIVSLVNGVENNSTSAYYSRHDHIHPQQLIYDGNVTVTKYTKSGGTATEVLYANGATINGVVDITSNQKITGIKTFDSFKKTNGTNQQILLADGTTKITVYAIRSDTIEVSPKYVKLCTLNPFFQNNCMSVEFRVQGRSGIGLLQFHQMVYVKGLSETTRTCELWIQLTAWSNAVVKDYTNSGTITSLITNIFTTPPVDELPTDYAAIMQINPTPTSYDDGLRISRTDPISTGNSSIQLGCSRTSNTCAIEGQWSIFTPSSSSINNPQRFVIAVWSQAGDNTRGLYISAEGNTLTFNDGLI
ncbi:MAG: hypothetical protein EZS28_034278 [Streblomastix strix]|uniref:Uncharacterized protein n=1 Tax=Streblomastix strix TaxID=222440 RepID=A0A5J4UKD7_9EUKA|nr:MAG: hypothetical protein EZS28_034278 [Streblomastix strix]